MKNSYKSFLNAYGYVANLTSEYLPDHANPFNVINLTRDHFYEKIYVDRQISSKIFQELLTTSGQLLFLVGPRGSGKSTVGIKLTKEFRKLGIYNLFLSISKNDANQYLDDRKNIVSFLRETIQNDMKKEIFFEKDSIIAQAELTSYFLCEDLPDFQRPSIYNGYFFDAQFKLRSFRNTSKLIYSETCEWLSINENCFHPEIQKIHQQVLGKLEITHLSHAIEFLLKKESQIIWIDNVDVFEQEAQNILIDSIFSISGSEPEKIKFVIAAREENVLRFNHFYDAQNSIQRTTVSISEDTKEYFPGLNMPTLPIEHFEEIINQRLDFSREFQKLVEKKSIGILNNPQNTTPIQFEKSKSEFEKYLPVITDLQHKYIGVISKKLTVVFESEKALHLANNNIRLLLPMHCDFMAYLITNSVNEQNVPTVYYSRESVLKTQLIFWMITARRDIANEFRYFNIVNYSRSNYQVEGKSKGCFLPFMTLACIWNLCLRNRKNELGTFNSPTVSEVVNRMKLVCLFTEDEIKQSIINLYDPKSEFTMFVAIESRHRLANISELKDSHRIRITYKGKSALASLCNSFSFLFAMKTISDTSTNYFAYLDEEKLTKYVYEIIPDLIRIGEVHLTALNYIRQQEYFVNNPSWLDVYIDYFGIPLEKEFTRAQKCSRGIGSSPKKALYYDSLVNSVESYTKEIGNIKLQRKIKRIVEEYSSILNIMEHGGIPVNEEIKFSV